MFFPLIDCLKTAEANLPVSLLVSSELDIYLDWLLTRYALVVLTDNKIESTKYSLLKCPATLEFPTFMNEWHTKGCFVGKEIGATKKKATSRPSKITYNVEISTTLMHRAGIIESRAVVLHPGQHVRQVFNEIANALAKIGHSVRSLVLVNSFRTYESMVAVSSIHSRPVSTLHIAPRYNAIPLVAALARPRNSRCCRRSAAWSFARTPTRPSKSRLRVLAKIPVVLPIPHPMYDLH